MLSTTHQIVDGLLLQLPHNVREQLREILLSESFRGVITAIDAQEMANELGESKDGWAMRLLPFAAAYADPRISHFQVGEIGVGLSGNLYFGCNLEFPRQALSFTVHGEQCTVINAWINGEEGLETLVLPAPACGYCRQFLQELVSASDLRVLLPEQPPTRLSNLLPDAFTPSALGVQGKLMEREQHGLSLQGFSAEPEPVVNAALSAADMSYAPYTGSYSGAALLCRDGAIFHGPYAESVAFNPSVSPIQSALSSLRLGGYSYDVIVDAVLVELPRARVSQIAATQAVLSSISHSKLRVIHADAMLGG